MEIPRPEQLDTASRSLRVIAHPVRLQILCNLITRNMNVSELIEETKISQPVLSQHLARLRALDIVSGERRGQQIIYRLADPNYSSIIAAVKHVYCSDTHTGEQGTPL